MTLVVFDFDGTLSDSEMTVLLGEQCGAADRMDEITTAAMNDEIDYAESLRRRCDLLAELPETRARTAFEQVQLRPGTSDLLGDLDSAGVETAILTGGFERGVRAALTAADASVDTVVANRLPVADGELAGEVEGPLIEGTKDDALDVLCSALGVDRTDTVAVGDGANDLPMLEAAGLAVGFSPKPAVEPACDIVVDSMDKLGEVLRNEGVL
ncbi:phosphoserine phosphatase SerB [Halovenus salina]|uniref:phosphoserine phosphatase n=1 Tax=Halovenus salina TaxID=1510225 RepID=A0ABD5W4C6_9EURY|nr:phosphoserine phosphatase SerB [Halovenus salina]